MTNFLILIPSLDPDEKITFVVRDLKLVGFTNFLIINDGSTSDYYFRQLEKEYHCTILTHSENQGKGRALKTGFKYSKTVENIDYLLTVDGDYQHKAEDVLAVAKTLEQSEANALVLGVRNFSKKENIPFRSWIGNQMSALMLAMMIGKKLKDTQTGLRGFPISALDNMLEIEGERFEYETNVLLYARKKGYQLIETQIKTVYIEDNKTSHFQPIKDSMKVFSVMFKFVCSSCISFLVDISLYSALIYLFFQGEDTVEDVMLASIVARLVSSVVNFTLNYKTVFSSEEKLKVAIIKYYSLAIVLMFASSFITGIMVEWNQMPVLMKLLVDGILFVLSYSVQKNFIFSGKRRKE